VTPVVSVCTEGTLYFMTGPDEQKAKNLRANLKVALTTGANTWDRGLDVVVEGTARRVTDDATLKTAADAWARTWDGRWTLAVADGSIQHVVDGEPQDYGTIVYAIDPTVAYAHAKGTFAHTRFTY
jgi:nitroimidazol reductase NimA-like FMN-containing flavoprotein (pyridoxamine 5'-phosphate oxidase superfamily)